MPIPKLQVKGEEREDKNAMSYQDQIGQDNPEPPESWRLRRPSLRITRISNKEYFRKHGDPS